MKQKWLILMLLLPAAALSRSNLPPDGREGAFVCGTSPQRQLNALVKGRYFESRSRMRGRAETQVLPGSEAQSLSADYGDIAVIEDDGSAFPVANLFNLQQKTIRFEPAGSGAYHVVSGSTGYDQTVGTVVELGDDDSAEVPLGFSFSFYGSSYDRIEVNSDGNLTFGTGDKASAERDLARFLSGPPRVSPFFADLNPQSSGTVSYHATDDGMVFNWHGVPEYDSNFKLNNFSVKLLKDGSVEFAYGYVSSGSAIVGIAPGYDVENVNAIDYSAPLPTEPLAGAIAEVFDAGGFSETALAKLFFKTHPDEFDQLVVFLAFPYSISGAFSYELNIRNEVQGIGLDVADYSRNFGSNGRLRSFVLMGSLSGAGRFPSEPSLEFFRGYNTLEVLAHEVAHRWLAHPLLLEGTQITSDLLFDTDHAHWSFLFNSNASVMEGVRLNDAGADKGDARFSAVEATDKYSELDRYLMGYGRPEDVPPMFFVQNATRYSSSTLPFVGGLPFGGTRRDFTIDAITGANGTRSPTFFQYPKVFRQAFILMTRHGDKASPDDIAKLQSIHDAWTPYFNQQTGDQAYAVTDLQSAPGTKPAAMYFPYFQGNSNRYTGIAVANWGTTPADISFQALNNDGQPLASPANIINPRMITVAPGSQTALLAEQIHGLALGDPRDGWIQAQSSSNQVSGFFLDGDVAQNFLDGAVAGSNTNKNLCFTQAVIGASVTPGSTFANLIDIVNPSDSPANLSLTMKDDKGQTEGTPATRVLKPHGRLAEDLSSLFPGISKPRTTGYVSVTSDVAVVGYQSIDVGTTVYSLPAQPSSAATTLYSAQFASGRAGAAQYFTDINLINTAVQARSVQLLLVNNEGVQAEGPYSVPLGAGQQFRRRGESIFNLPDPSSTSSLVQGSLVITADGPGVVGDVTFGDARAGRFIASLPLDWVPASTLVFSQVAQGIGGGPKPYFTGIAFYNPNGTPVSVTVDVYSAQGKKTGSAVIPITAGGRISRTLPEFVPEIKEQVGGYIRVTASGGPVSAFELFGSQNLDFLTAVPPQPINP